MQKTAANCGSLKGWKVPPRGVERKAKETLENATCEGMQDDGYAKSARMARYDLRSEVLLYQLLLESLKHLKESFAPNVLEYETAGFPLARQSQVLNLKRKRLRHWIIE